MSPHKLFFRTILMVPILFFSVNAFSQSATIDSLKNEVVKYEARKKTLGSAFNRLMDTVKINTLNKIAYHYYMAQSPIEGIDYGLQALQLSEKLGTTKKTAKAANVLGALYTFKGELDKGIFYQKIALKAAKIIKDPQLEGYVYCNIGAGYTQMGNYSEALTYLFKGVDLSIKHDEGPTLSACYNNIGNIYTNQKQYDEALKIYNAALNYQKKHNDFEQMGYTQQNVGRIYMNLEKFAAAGIWYSNGLQSGMKAGNKEVQANNYDGLANVALQMKKYDLALQHANKALVLRQEIDDVTGLGNTFVNIGNIYLKQKKYSAALTNIRKGIRIAQESESTDGLKEGYEYLSIAYEETGEFQKAYESHIAFKRISDSLFNSEKDKKLTEQRLTYDFNTKEKEQKALQQKKDAANDLKSKQQRSAIYAVLIALIIVTFFAFWINYNLQRNKKQKKTIEEQNEKIQQSLGEKETLLREIHHRVKNNLQIISSLLNIQSENIKDETLLSSIQEGQSRVQAMSLIHQNLYQSEQVNNVDIENYLRELVVYLSQMFRADSKHIDTEINTDGIQFDIDTAIPLGLIVNELVSNAYKYAFENREKGHIKISIRAVGNDYELHIDNDGKPLPEDFDIMTTKSLGLKLVSILSRQLRGKFSFHSDERKTSFTVLFKDLKTIA